MAIKAWGGTTDLRSQRQELQKKNNVVKVGGGTISSHPLGRSRVKCPKMGGGPKVLQASHLGGDFNPILYTGAAKAGRQSAEGRGKVGKVERVY